MNAGRNLWPAAVALLGLLLSGCAVEQAGDAKAYLGPTLGGRDHDTLFLPQFSLGEPARFEFDVDYGEPTYVRAVRFYTRERQGWRYTTPWEDSRLLVTATSMDGEVLYRRRVAPLTWEFLDLGEYESLIIPRRESGEVPARKRYRVIVEVLVPSDRRADLGRIMLAVP